MMMRGREGDERSRGVEGRKKCYQGRGSSRGRERDEGSKEEEERKKRRNK